MFFPKWMLVMRHYFRTVYFFFLISTGLCLVSVWLIGHSLESICWAGVCFTHTSLLTLVGLKESRKTPALGSSVCFTPPWKGRHLPGIQSNEHRIALTRQHRTNLGQHEMKGGSEHSLLKLRVVFIPSCAHQGWGSLFKDSTNIYLI